MTESGIIKGTQTYIAGRWVDGERSFAVENPADESLVADAAVTPLAEVGRADRVGPEFVRRRCVG